MQKRCSCMQQEGMCEWVFSVQCCTAGRCVRAWAFLQAIDLCCEQPLALCLPFSQPQRPLLQSKEYLRFALTFITNSFVLRQITCHPKLTYTPTFLYLLVLVYIPQFQISSIINASIVIIPTLLIIKY